MTEENKHHCCSWQFNIEYRQPYQRIHQNEKKTSIIGNTSSPLTYPKTSRIEPVVCFAAT